jgi:catechol 2,3-dioxygenase-like lactoylglutathione lyase family enzyme
MAGTADSKIARARQLSQTHNLITKGSSPNMSTPNSIQPIIELRVALTTSDYERLVNFYCDGLGLEPAAIWNNGQGKALILDMGKATLELFDEAQAETIDQLEAGQRISGQIRFALQVPDLKTAMERLLAHGAILVRPPVITPWGDHNVRLQDPDGMQITLFQASNNQGKST